MFSEILTIRILIVIVFSHISFGSTIYATPQICPGQSSESILFPFVLSLSDQLPAILTSVDVHPWDIVIARAGHYPLRFMVEAEAPTVNILTKSLVDKLEPMMRNLSDQLSLQVEPNHILITFGEYPLIEIHIRETRPKLAIIIDDLGKFGTPQEVLKVMPWQVAYAVLPGRILSHIHARLLYEQGHEILAHLPLEPKNKSKIDGPGFLYLNMTEEEFKSTARKDIEGIPFAIGVNNHMGSLVTVQAKQINWLLDIIEEKKMLFVDSRTTSETIAYEAAYLRGIPTGVRNIFIDDTIDKNAIVAELDKLKQMAIRNGSALAIGHPSVNTIHALVEFLRENEEILTLIPISRYVMIPANSRIIESVASFQRRAPEMQ